MKYLAKNLKWLREQRGLKQTDLKAIIGFNSTTWNNYEKGVSKPGLDDMIKISKYFGFPESDILHKDLSIMKKQQGSSYSNDNADQGLVAENVAEYRRLCELKDQTIAAQQGQIEVLTIIANQNENKKRKTSKKRK